MPITRSPPVRSRFARSGRALLATILLAALLLPRLDAPASAQAGSGTKQVTIVVPFAAGGPSDAMARLIAQGLGDRIGARVIVENIAGAGGTIGSARVSRAPPDGQTLLFGNIGTHAANVGLFKNLPYDPQVDFEPVMLVANVPFVVAARRGLPVDSFAGLRALASVTPGGLTYGSAGVGSASHLACLLLDAAMGANARHIPYRGAALAMNDLVGGQIDFMCDQTVTMIPQVRSGTVHPLGVLSRQRIAQLPDLPTAVEAGLPEVQVEAWNALFAPKGTPRAIVEQLFAVTWAALASPATRARFAELGASIPSQEEASPDALRKHVAVEVSRWTRSLKASGVAPD
jgi:tripartite-type tricarboxylate transporter receptor subunit TctC